MPRSLYVVTGTGAIALRHSRLLRTAGNEVVHVRRFGTTSGDQLDGAPVVSSLEEALSQHPVAGIVATAAPDHVPSACAMLERGLDVLIEKPLAEDAAGARSLVELAASSKGLSMVAYCLRFRAGIAALTREAGTGRIGRPLGFRAVVGQFLPDWRPGRDYRETVSARRALGGGALLELSHEIDLALLILGPVVSVVARAAKHSNLEIDVEDTADLILEHATGAMSNLHLDMTDRASNRSCRLTGTEGTLEWVQGGGGLRCFRPSMGWSPMEKEDPDAGARMYEEQWRYFEDCRREREKPHPSVDEGVAVLRVVDAARRSEATGQKEFI